MPRVNYYKAPEGTRKLEFWKQYRNGEKAENVTVPAKWDDHDIEGELEDWAGLEFHNWPVRYGWNDEADFGKRE